jgi:hypothetical protein
MVRVVGLLMRSGVVSAAWGFRCGCGGCTTRVEAVMSQHVFELIAGAVFMLICLGHVFRLIFGVAFVVYGVSIPMWASGIAVVIMGYLAYEGFRLARKSASGT